MNHQPAPAASISNMIRLVSRSCRMMRKHTSELIMSNFSDLKPQISFNFHQKHKIKKKIIFPKKISNYTEKGVAWRKYAKIAYGKSTKRQIPNVINISTNVVKSCVNIESIRSDESIVSIIIEVIRMKLMAWLKEIMVLMINMALKATYRWMMKWKVWIHLKLYIIQAAPKNLCEHWPLEILARKIIPLTWTKCNGQPMKIWLHRLRRTALAQAM